jgi:hypothetical protein
VDLLRHDREEFQRQMGQASLGFDPESLEARLQEAGFGGGRVRALTPEPGAKGPALVLATATKAGRVVSLGTGRKKGKPKS